MLAAGASGSGKTLITCGLLQAFTERELAVSSFKCGPDYIDSMFQRTVIGEGAGNLDTFFLSDDAVRHLLEKKAAKGRLSVIEGVMGFYDGLGGVSEEASSWDIARVAQCPVVLVVNCRGMSLSILPYIKGFWGYKGSKSLIRGVILNQVSAVLYDKIKALIEEQIPEVRVLGYVPVLRDFTIESRHLGLVMPKEIPYLKDRLHALSQQMEKTVDIDGLICLAKSAPPLNPTQDKPDPAVQEGFEERSDHAVPLRIAISCDEAFCFWYEDNLDVLRQMGAELVEFSPLHDRMLPDDIDGLLLCGGYPELHLPLLSENETMKTDIRTRVEGGLPTIAECGGYMYLCDEIVDQDRIPWPCAGVIHTRAYYTGKLSRFGYLSLTTDKTDSLLGRTGTIRCHEYHYFDTEDNGTAFHAQKPSGGKEWDCVHTNSTLWAGFPHLYYYSNLRVPQAFLRACGKYHKERKKI